MVKVREYYPLTATGEVELNQWAEQIASVAGLPKDAQIQLQKAANSAYIASQHSQSADSSFLTGLEMASILAEFRLDEDALIAAVIYPSICENTSTTHAMHDVCSLQFQTSRDARKSIYLSPIVVGGLVRHV